MKWVIIIVRTFLGGVFTLMSSNYFFEFFKMDMTPPSLEAEQFMTAMNSSGYFDAVKVVELTGGVLLLTGIFAVVGLLFITPMVVNIVFYHVFMGGMQPQEWATIIILPLLVIFLIFCYRDYSSRVFHPWPTPRW